MNYANRTLSSVVIGMFAFLPIACGGEDVELIETRAQQLEIERTGEDRVEVAGVYDLLGESTGSVAPAWSSCRRSNTTVTAFKGPRVNNRWGTYPGGLIFADLGQSDGRFRNWWGPGDPFPGQGEAWIWLNQTTEVPCPW